MLSSRSRHLSPEFSKFESSNRLQEFSLNSTTFHFHVHLFPTSVDFLSAALSIPCFPWLSQIKSRFSPEVGDFLVFLCFSANFLFQHWAPCWIFIYWENIRMIWNYQKWGEGLWRGVWQTDWKLEELSSSSSECQVNSFSWMHPFFGFADTLASYSQVKWSVYTQSWSMQDWIQNLRMSFLVTHFHTNLNNAHTLGVSPTKRSEGEGVNRELCPYSIHYLTSELNYWGSFHFGLLKGRLVLIGQWSVVLSSPSRMNSRMNFAPKAELSQWCWHQRCFLSLTWFSRNANQFFGVALLIDGDKTYTNNSLCTTDTVLIYIVSQLKLT